ncbi:hypothetical protein [Acidovorax sacchari]|uniref:hypothetical protein n=1 Tax=Acidovorax sacchari TaxID=3230736 RepID=UPI0039E6C086
MCRICVSYVGGISIALALSLPEFQGRDLVLDVTYVVVVFSLLVQATTLGLMVQHFSSPTTISEQTAPRKQVRAKRTQKAGNGRN